MAAGVIVEDRAWLGRLDGELRGELAPVFAQAASPAWPPSPWPPPPASSDTRGRAGAAATRPVPAGTIIMPSSKPPRPP